MSQMDRRTKLLLTICRCRHPCNEKPSVVADIGLRLQEGIQELKLEQQLAPAREAMARTLTVGSTNFFKAVEGVRGRWAQRSAPSTSPSPSLYGANDDAVNKSSRASTPPVEVSKADFEDAPRTAKQSDYNSNSKASHLRPFSLTSTNSLPSDSPNTSPTAGLANMTGPLSSWGAGIGSFLSAKTSRFSMMKTPTTAQPQENISYPSTPPSRPSKEIYGEPEGSPLFNGLSPGTSPTSVEPTASIGSVLVSNNATARRILPSGLKTLSTAPASTIAQEKVVVES